MPFFRKDAEPFKGKAAAEKSLADLQKNNPGKTFYLVAMQLTATNAGLARFNGLKDDGPLNKHVDLNGIIDPKKLGEFNFATQFRLPNGRTYWEWMSKGLDAKDPVDKAPSALRHREDLPKGYDATFYLVVEKLPWKY